MILTLNNILKAEGKPKLSVSIFADEDVCWTCLKSINTISKVKLKNYQLDVIIYFCSDNDKLLSELVKKYELKCKSQLDPECLYAKKYNFSRLPAIVIKDKSIDSVLIEKNWENPREYINLITEYDKKLRNTIEKESYLSTPVKIKEKDGTPKNMQYCTAVYNHKFKRYYCFMPDQKTISILDTNGFVSEEINLQDYKEIEEFWAQGSPYFMNDTILVWRSTSKKNSGQQVMYGFNIISKKIEKKGIIDESHTTENSSIYEYNVIPAANKLVFTKYYFKNDTLNRNENLLMLTDSNFNFDKYFGRVDPICETTSLAAHFMCFPITPVSVDSSIYYLMSFSKNLYVFDLDGNYLNTIELDFEKDYNPPLMNIPEVISSYDIWDKYKIVSNVYVQKNRIIVIALNVRSNKETLKQENIYYITVFNKSGKRIANTIKLPNGLINGRQMVGDKLLFIESGDEGSKSIRWLDINKMISQ